MTRNPAMVVDQLEEVAVARDDVDGDVGAGREGSDDVVGLVGGRPHDRDAEHLERRADHRQLRRQRIGDLFDVGTGGRRLHDAMRLVARQQVDAPGRAPVVVPARDEMRGRVGAHELGDHVEQASRRVHRGAVRCRDLVGHAVEGAEVQRRGVEEHEAVGHASDPGTAGLFVSAPGDATRPRVAGCPSARRPPAHPRPPRARAADRASDRAAARSSTAPPRPAPSD